MCINGLFRRLTKTEQFEVNCCKLSLIFEIRNQMLEIHQHSWSLVSLLLDFSRLSLTSKVTVFEFYSRPSSFLIVHKMLTSHPVANVD